MQFLTDGREKYIHFPHTGRELFFDLTQDRDELHDLAANPSCAERVVLWRKRLIDLLGQRGDGFSDGERLLVRRERWGPHAEPPAS